jgi:biopolymer transport protein ExbB/TolQ
MELFLIAAVALALKWFQARKQKRIHRDAILALDELSLNRSDIGEDASGERKAEWYHAIWQTQESAVRQCWMGQRVAAILQRQLKRKSTHQLDHDLMALAERDADQQHDSYSLIRIVTWAMPMLGFLGTVIGISDTLGQMDASALASGSQDAMNSLTAGLYVAFDTTAIGLVMTMVAMFLQFFVNRSEVDVLGEMDTRVSESMHGCLSVQEKDRNSSELETALQTMVRQLATSVQDIVNQQSQLWKATIDAAHEHWQNLNGKSAETLTSSLADAITASMERYDENVKQHSEHLVRIQAEGAALIDSRWRQWQTTFSDQARSVHQQQKEMTQQTELLQSLIDKHVAIREMEQPLQSTLQRLTDIDRFHDAAICLTEAVAVLGTQMERYGYLGRQPLRRASKEVREVPADAEVEGADEPVVTLPLKRRAG